MTDASVLSGEIGALIALVDEGRVSEAEYEARILLARHPTSGMLWKILGVALLRQGKGALHALRRTAELLPHDAEAHGNLALGLQEKRQLPDALASWRRTLDIQPRNLDALIGAADVLRALGRTAEAVGWYERALAVDPKSPEARNNLGNALLELRRADDAVACYRRAIEIKPDDPQLHCNLSNALRLQGAFDEAVTSGRQALVLDENLGSAHSHLGAVLRDLGQFREAASHFRRALELDPQEPKNHCDLGNALFDLRRPEAAVECYRHALALRSDYAAAHLSLSAALRLLRRADEAEASCQAALALEPHNVEAWSFLGELRADQGRFEEAHELFQRAIRIDPSYPFAFCSIAMHRKMTATDHSWRQGVEALLDRNLPMRHEASLRYALGKYFDDLGQYADAFGQYARANALTKRQDSSYDGAKLTRQVDRIIDHCNTTFVRNAASHASSSELPVFIIGMPRSGTSLAEQILASHPAVVGAGELKFWDTAFRGLTETAGDGDLPAHRVADAYLARLPAQGEGIRRVIDKMPANFLYAGFIHAVFPQARIIHMQRHPLDTCLSVYFQNFFGIGRYANDFADLAHYYGEYVRITDHWRSMLPGASLLEIPYEGLIADQETWTRRMVEFIGLPWDPKCLDFERTERVVITASKWQVRQKIHARSAGRWRNYEPWIGPLVEALRQSRVEV
jgi:tetratricopeptide (TPR) repeat protein